MSTVTDETTAPRPVLLDGVVPYPPDAAARYREAGWWTGVTIGAELRAVAARTPGAVALVDDRRTATYAELDAAVDAVAHGARALGIERGDRVVVHVPNSADLVEVFLGLVRAGVVPVLALPAHRRTEVEYFARHTEAVAIVAADPLTLPPTAFDHLALADRVAGLVPSVAHALTPTELRAAGAASSGPAPDAAHASDVALLQLSGGSTGTPKLIPRTHDDYLYSVRESARICGLDAGSVYLAALPVAHNYGLTSPGALGVLHAGGTVVLARDAAPDVAFGLVEEHGVTHVALVPPLARVWADSALARRGTGTAGPDLSSLRLVQVGGAKLGTATAHRVLDAFGGTPEAPGATLQQVFGMAEGLVCYTRLDDPLDVVTTTQGRPISPGDEVLVVDDRDVPVPDGVAGHLLTRGPYTIRGYYRAPEHDRRAFTAHGFYRTGDLVTRDAAGYLTVTGRAKDQINRGGEKVAPEEVENHLRAHPAVLDASVLGEADEHLGERILARVVLRRADGGEPALHDGRPVTGVVLRRYLRERDIAAFKLPDRFEIVTALPTTAVGKTDRKGPAAAPAAATEESAR